MATQNGQGPINVFLNHGGASNPVQVPAGSELGYIRQLSDDLEDIGAPDSYNLAIGGVQQADSTPLGDGQTVSFRPVSGSKG